MSFWQAATRATRTIRAFSRRKQLGVARHGAVGRQNFLAALPSVLLLKSDFLPECGRKPTHNTKRPSVPARTAVAHTVWLERRLAPCPKGLNRNAIISPPPPSRISAPASSLINTSLFRSLTNNGNKGV